MLTYFACPVAAPSPAERNFNRRRAELAAHLYFGADADDPAKVFQPFRDVLDVVAPHAIQAGETPEERTRAVELCNEAIDRADNLIVLRKRDGSVSAGCRAECARWMARTNRTPDFLDLEPFLVEKVGMFMRDNRRLQLAYDVAMRPDLAGPPQWVPGPIDPGPISPEDSDTKMYVRLRAQHLQTALWYLGVLTQLDPDAKNHVAYTVDYPAAPRPEAPPEMHALAGYRLEVACVKPGKKGPAEMLTEAQDEIARLRALLAGGDRGAP